VTIVLTDMTYQNVSPFGEAHCWPTSFKRAASTSAGNFAPLFGINSPAATGFARMMELAGVEPGIPFKIHPHMLRHACGFALANKGHDTRALQACLGHRNIQHTVRYTELSPTRFKNFWRS
jgi:integrase